MQQIHIDCVPQILEIRLVPVSTVVKNLNLKITSFADRSLPARKNVPPGKAFRLKQNLRVRRSVRSSDYARSRAFIIDVALEGEMVARILRPVRPKTGLYSAPAIEIVSIGMVLRAAIEPQPAGYTD